MRSFWSDPYLWVHLAGVAAVPIFLDFCLLGLAVGEPVLPSGVEIGIVAVSGILPVLWMQWRSPFYIFSLLALALRPTRLTEDQKRILRQFKTPLVKILTTLNAIILGVVLWQLYQLAPIAAVNSPWNAESRWLGLLVAASAFLGANLFSQVPASVAAVLMTSKRAFASVKPYPVEAVFRDFTVLGFPVRQILPLADPPVVMSSTTASSKPEATPTTVETDLPSPELATTDVVVIAPTDVVELELETPADASSEVSDNFENSIAELEGLSQTLADAFDGAETNTDASEATEAPTSESIRETQEPSSSAPLRQPPSYEDPETTVD